jgi:hypothetical protein
MARARAAEFPGYQRVGLMTITLCADLDVRGKPGLHVSRDGKGITSVRLWWLLVAVAWYRMDDRELVRKAHGWTGS